MLKFEEIKEKPTTALVATVSGLTFQEKELDILLFDTPPSLVVDIKGKIYQVSIQDIITHIVRNRKGGTKNE